MSSTNNDTDFQSSAVSSASRKSNLSMFMIMMGFTFFSASMWVGQKLSQGLDFSGFIYAMILGGLILGAYTGALGYIGAKTGLSLDLLAQRTFGTKGSYLPSAMISLTQAGWFGVGLAMFAIPVARMFFGDDMLATWIMVIGAGILMTSSAYFGIKSLAIISYIAVPCVAILGTIAMCMAISQGESGIVEQFNKSSEDIGIIAGAGMVVGSFVSGGTATPNFSRFSKSAKAGCLITIIAFFIGNSLMFCFGAVSAAYTGGNDIFDVMVNLNLFYFAILVLGLNIWTTNDNALYTTGLGLANITGRSKKEMVLLCGIIGTVAAIWLYNNFCGYLNILNCTLPPIGIILIMGYFMNRKDFDRENVQVVNWSAIIGVIAGAVIANVLDWGVTSINSMIVAAVIHAIGNQRKLFESKKVIKGN